MVVGLIAAAANGTGLPLMIIIFGDMTNAFVLSGVNSSMSEGKFRIRLLHIPLCFATGAKTGTCQNECMMNKIQLFANYLIIFNCHDLNQIKSMCLMNKFHLVWDGEENEQPFVSSFVSYLLLETQRKINVYLPHVLP